MKKIIVSLGNALGLFASAGVILKYMYMILVYPFISKELTTLTWLGVFILVLALEVFTLIIIILRRSLNRRKGE